MKVDATNKTLGRLASEAAKVLQGKHKPNYQPHLSGDESVEISNVDKIKLTGKKMEQKVYYKHTGYPGNLKSITLEKLFEKDPQRVVELAVKGMLPKNKLRDRNMKRLIIK